MVQLELVTLAGPKVQEQVYEVILPAADGAMAIYPHHMPIVTRLVPGIISVRRTKNGEAETFVSNGGVAEFGADTLRILVDEADRPNEINEQEAREALERAKQLKQDAKDKVELDQAQLMVDRAAVRIKVAELRRRHHRDRPVQ